MELAIISRPRSGGGCHLVEPYIVAIFGNFSSGSNGVVSCPCNWTYSPSDPDDAAMHARHRVEFTRVTTAKRHVPTRSHTVSG